MDFSGNALVQRCIEFSLLAIDFCGELEDARKFVVSNQLLRSATSIGANVMEAQSAESNADFIHKLKVADKEAHEKLVLALALRKGRSIPLPSGTPGQTPRGAQPA